MYALSVGCRSCPTRFVAAHKGSNYQKHVHCVAGQWKNTKCYWYKHAAEKKIAFRDEQLRIVLFKQERAEQKTLRSFLALQRMQVPKSGLPSAGCRMSFQEWKALQVGRNGLLRWQKFSHLRVPGINPDQTQRKQCDLRAQERQSHSQCVARAKNLQRNPHEFRRSIRQLY